MANLDDFFKKKDTKKTKSKKFAVNNPLSLNSNDQVKNEKVKQEMPTSLDSATLSTNKNDLFSIQTVDEWRDYVEEEKKDYSGLKIQNLQISDGDTDKQNSKQNHFEESEINEQGETVVKKNLGPWKILQEQKKEEVQPTPVPEKVAAPPPNKVEDKFYSIPHLRNNNNFSEEQNKLRHNAKKTPSDLSSEELFPSLGATVSRSGR